MEILRKAADLATITLDEDFRPEVTQILGYRQPLITAFYQLFSNSERAIRQKSNGRVSVRVRGRRPNCREHP